MTNTEADPSVDFEPVPFDDPVDLEAAAEHARSERIGAWAEAGATSFPALIVAIGSGIIGAVAVFIRKRRRR
jgi:hypothetical protein